MRPLHLIWSLFCCCHQLIDNFELHYKSKQAQGLVVDIQSVLLAPAVALALKWNRGFGLQLFLTHLGVKQRGGGRCALVWGQCQGGALQVLRVKLVGSGPRGDHWDTFHPWRRQMCNSMGIQGCGEAQEFPPSAFPRVIGSLQGGGCSAMFVSLS